MARTPGQLVFPANIERNMAAPLDAAMKVIGVSSLTNPETFKAINDGINYAYVGMFTVVTGDSDKNNGLYILKAFPTTNINNWQKLQASTDSRLNTQSKNIIDAINEINVKTGDTSTGSSSTTIPAGGSGFLKFNETDDYLELDSNAITEYTISLLISGKTEKCFLKKVIEFSANTLSEDNIIISHATVTDEDAINAEMIGAVIDMEQVDNLPHITLKLSTKIECDAFLLVDKNINITLNK